MYIYRRKNGELYIVPYSGGISRIASENLISDSIEFVHFNKRNGLPSDLAYAITESNDSSLWITFQKQHLPLRYRDGNRRDVRPI